MTTASLTSALRNVRIKAGLSLRKLAKNSNISAAYLCDIERHRRHCSLTVANALLKSLGLPQGEHQAKRLNLLNLKTCPSCGHKWSAQ